MICNPDRLGMKLYLKPDLDLDAIQQKEKEVGFDEIFKLLGPTVFGQFLLTIKDASSQTVNPDKTTENNFNHVKLDVAKNPDKNTISITFNFQQQQQNTQMQNLCQTSQSATRVATPSREFQNTQSQSKSKKSSKNRTTSLTPSKNKLNPE